MIAQFSEKLINSLVTGKYIPAENREACMFATISTLEKGLSLLAIVVLGLCFKVPLETVVFLCFFMNLKKHTGGYHTESFASCFLVSICTYIVVAQMLRLIRSFYQIPILIVVAISILFIVLVAPVNHPNYAGSDTEMQYHRKKILATITFEVMAYLVVMWVLPFSCFLYASFSFVLTAALILFAKLKKQDDF